MAWIVKYKPKCLDDLILSKKIKERINNVKYQNLMITGKSGKTSILHCVAKSLYKGIIDEAVYVLNIIDDRSLKTIQDSLETFCKKKISKPIKKMIIIDDLDEIFDKIQQIISNLMEIYEKKVIFMISCNDLTKIIETIQEKCVIIKIKNPNIKNALVKMKQICDNENIKYNDDGLKSIYNYSNGNMVHIINNLQIVGSYDNEINIKNVRDVLEIPDPDLIENIFNLCENKKFIEANNLIISLHEKGTSCFDILNGMLNFLKYNEKLKDNVKIKFLEIISDCLIQLNSGVESKLQLSKCISMLIL